MMPYEGRGNHEASIHPLYPFPSHYHVVSGQRMHYLDEGRGDPVVFLHGNPTWSFLYRDYVRALRNEHRIIAVDHIGCGLSDKPAEDQYPFTLERRITDLECLLDFLDLRGKVSLAVHDWGGPIGFGYAVRHPERIKQIAVFNTAAFFWPSGKAFPLILRICRKSRAAGYLIIRANAFVLPTSYLMCAKQRIDAVTRKGYLLPYRSWAHRTAILRFIQDIPLEPDHVSYRTMSDIQQGLVLLRDVPMIVFWGGRDFIFDRDICSEWSRYFPKARIHLFPDAGHNILEDERDAILPMLRNFLAAESRA
jgi:pimeloyl-ACP methyl ester carboxylesterase